jgi:hypothetical protein
VLFPTHPALSHSLLPILFLYLAVVADYVPKMLQVPARIGVLGLSSAMFLGLMKLSIAGPGIGGELTFFVCEMLFGFDFTNAVLMRSYWFGNFGFYLCAGALKEIWKSSVEPIKS